MRPALEQLPPPGGMGANTCFMALFVAVLLTGTLLGGKHEQQ
jgi:hypothetical protein